MRGPSLESSGNFLAAPALIGEEMKMRPALIGGGRGPLDCCWARFSGSLRSTLLSNRVRMCRPWSGRETAVRLLVVGEGRLLFPRPEVPVVFSHPSLGGFTPQGGIVTLRCSHWLGAPFVLAPSVWTWMLPQPVFLVVLSCC